MKLSRNILIKLHNNTKAWADLLQYLITAIAIIPLTLYILNLKISDLRYPLLKGDLLSHYQYQFVFWDEKKIISQHFGWPEGQNISTWPFLDLFQTLIVGFFHLFTPNIFLAVNLAIIFSFLFSFSAVFWCATKLEIRGWNRILVGLLSINVPWFSGRIHHFDFLFIFTALAPLIIYFTADRKKIHYFLIISLGLLSGTCGPYIFIFSCLITCLVLFHAYFTSNKFRGKLRELLIYLLVTLFSFIFTYLFFTRGNSESFSSLNRSLEESVHLSGYFFMLVMPLPFTYLPFINKYISEFISIRTTTETTQYSNYGTPSLLLSFLIILFFVGYYFKTRGNFDNSRFIYNNFSTTRANIGALLLLCVGLVLIFSKGFFGVIISSLVPQIRAWNRLTPLIQVILFLTSFIILDLVKNRKFIKFIKFIFCVLLFWNIYTLHSGSFVNIDKEEYNDVVQLVEKINILSGPGCPVLQLPDVGYPLNGDTFKMGDYDHFLVSLIDQKMKWSYGHSKTSKQSEPFDFLTKLESDAFCGVLIDTFGYGDNQVMKYLEENFGHGTSVGNLRYHYFVIKN